MQGSTASTDQGDLAGESRMLLIRGPEMNCKANQRDRSHGVVEWAKFQCHTIKVDRLVDATSSSLFKNGDERFCV